MENRPTFLNLFQISFPITAIASILHRISGVLLFLAIPLTLCTLETSLKSQSDFDLVKSYLTSDLGKIFVFVSLSSMLYHLLAGFRHIIMDFGIGETKCAGKASAYILFALSVILIVYIGLNLWFL